MDSVTNCIRCLSADVVQKANSGHPGAPMGMAPMAAVLFSKVLKFDSSDAHWPDRDRFILSNGHASSLLYVMLHLCGYNISMEDLKQFRQLGSKTPGHPELHVTDGVEVTTGPLGQGISNAVGMAIAEAHLAAVYNRSRFKIVDHYTFVFCGDGCLMEGITMEALSLAGHLALNKLIIIYDDNRITIDGPTSLTFTENTAGKYKAMGFNIIPVANGNNDYKSMINALKAAKSSRKPSIILLKTTIGFGSAKQGTSGVHGAPLGGGDIAKVKKLFGRDPTRTFYVEEAVYNVFREAASRGKREHQKWTETMRMYSESFPKEADEFKARMQGFLPEGWMRLLPTNKDLSKKVATRNASEKVLSALVPAIPSLIGGSADLAPSNLTRPKDAKMVDFQPRQRRGRYIRYGVREHGMCGIMNGLSAHGGFIPYGGTFLSFIGYATGAVRIAALSQHQVIYVATHDSIGVGEDGPTHQPTDIVVGLRAIPNLLVMRPTDQTETSACWAIALESTRSPTCMCLSRQGTVQQPNSCFDGVRKGAYTIYEAEDPQLIIIATGSEVGFAVNAAKNYLKDIRTRVVSMPIMSLFDEQPETYKQAILPEGVPVLSVETYHPYGWDKYSHYHMGMEGWGASAPAATLYKHFGFTAANVAQKGRDLVRVFGRNAPRKRVTSEWTMKSKI